MFGINRKLNLILRQLEVIMADLTALTAAVAKETTVEQSAIVLIQQLAAEVKANASDPVAIAALADQINSSATALAAAVTANTPPAPPASTPAPAP